MVQEELCLLALQAADDAYTPDNDTDFAELEPPDGYTAEWIWNDPDTGFKAVLYSTIDDNGDRHGIVAFAGTEGAQDAVADLTLGWNQWQFNSQEFFLDLSGFQFSSFTFTGHSLGGALAQYATYEYVTNHSGDSGPAISLVTFNGLGGITALETHVDGFDTATVPAIDSAHFVVDGDLVSRLGGGHLGGDVYLLQRVASADFFDPVNDHATYLEGTPFNLLSGHTISNVQALVAVDGFQFFRAHTPDYLELSAILPYAAELTFSILDASRQVEDDVAINLLAAGLTDTLAEVARLPEESLERVQLETLLTETLANLRDGTNLFELDDRVFYMLLDHADLVELASIPLVNEHLETAAFFYSVETLLADAMQRTDNRLGPEGADALATLLIDYSQTMDVDLAGFETDLRERLVARFTNGEMFEHIGIANPSRLGTLIIDSFIDSSDLGDAIPDDASGFFRVGGKSLIAGNEHGPRTLDGSDGDDILLGKGDVHEVFLGFSGNDLLYGANGRDLIKGGAGDDWMLGGPGDDVLMGGLGNDRFEDGSGIDRLSDTGGDDRYELLDDGSMDTIIDADGAGRIFLGGVELLGGSSVDGSSTHFSDGVHHYRLVGSDLVIDDTVTVRDWQPGHLGITLEGAPVPPDPNLITGTDDADGGASLTGTDGDDAIYAFAGDDDLSGGLGNDQLYGGPGSDWLSATPGDDHLDGGPGNDILISGIDQDVLLGGPGVDFLSAGDGRDRLDGGLDDDVLAAGADDDILIGGDGNDRLYGDATYVPVDRTWSVSETTSDDGLVVNVLFDQVTGSAVSVNDGNDLLDGGAGDDDLIGGGGDDALAGGTGHDYLDGGYGHDRLEGGAGDDTLHGDAKLGSARETDGMDMLSGGPGNDWLEGGYGADYLEGGEGDDELHGDYLDDPLLGGHDLLDGGPGNDLLLGGAGDDTIHGRDGHDRADAGPGDDRVWGAAGDDTLLGDAGNDLLHGGADNDLIFGGSGDDGLAGGAGQDRLEGQSGHDTLLGGTGDDTLLGGEGDDRLSGDQGHDLIDGGAGADHLTGGAGNDHLQSGTDDDILEGDAGDDVLLGQEGHDELHGGEGHDLMAGGPGHDVLAGDSGNDQLWGEDGEDQLAGMTGDDILAGGPGNDTLGGGEDHDRLYGEDGDDRMHGDAGDDLLAGGMGHDLLEGGPGRDALHGEPGDDVMRGDAGADLMYGGPGGDVLDGGQGDDTLYGDQGADQLRGGPGQDLLVGGAGDDRYLFEVQDEQIRIVEQGDSVGDTLAMGSGLEPGDFFAGRSGDDLVLQHRVGDQRITVEGWFADPSRRLGAIGFTDGTLWTPDDLAAAADHRVGSQADDHLLGSPGNETLLGLEGHDTLDGMAGDDRLIAGAGDDRLHGGTGNDQLTGGSGSDRFTFASGDGVDTILDIESHDILEFLSSQPGDLGIRVDWHAGGHDLALVHGAGDEVLVEGGLELTDLSVDFPNATTSVSMGELVGLVATRDGYLEHRVTAIGASVDGTPLPDHVLGSTGSDIVSGHGGDDLLETGAGDDRLDGGSGNDRLHGGAGIDTYRIDTAMGHDIIVETTAPELSVIEVASGLNLADLEVRHDGDHLRIEVDAGQSSLTYLDWRNRREVAPLELRFADGTRVTGEELDLKIKTGSDGSDTLRSNPHPERLEGLGGNDTLLGRRGDDVLVGGSGDDLLDGGEGSDTYLFTAGHGQDRIIESGEDPLGIDRVILGSGSDPLDLAFSRSGVDLLVEQIGSDDQIIVEDWYGTNGPTIEEFITADGSTLDGHQVDLLIESMASFTESTGVAWQDATASNHDDVAKTLAGYWDHQGVAG